jgi:ceramide glucosyltransferase
MSLLAILAALGVAASLVYYLAATIAALRFARIARQPPPSLPKIPPRVAMLKPLRGHKPSLTGNLVSCLETDYPRTEFYFAVSGYDDPAAEVPVALRAQYQFAPLTMIIGEGPDCANRKVGKLIRMAERASRAEIFVLSDADIAMERDSIRRLVGELCAGERVGLVSCIYRARHNHSLGTRLEALYVNSDFAPQVMLSQMIEPMRFAFGAAIAVKREALEAIGGFARLKDLLADDYYIGKLVADQGYEVRLSSAIVTSVGEDRHLADFWHRQIRWARTQRTVRPASLATIFVQGPFWALLWLIASRCTVASCGALAIVVAARIAMASIIFRRVLKLGDQARGAVFVPFKDLLMVVIWFASLASNRVEWAGRRLEILPDGTMREVPAANREVHARA